MSEKERTLERPSPDEFGHYRDYLRAMVDYLKKEKRAFSSRSFARRAGYSSAGFLHDVIDGRRGLATGAIEKFAHGLGLSARETEAFESLVLMNQATTDDQRNRHYERLRRNGHSKNPHVQFTSDQYDVLSLWYAFPIREMVMLPDFQEDPDWIAGRLFPPVRPSEAKKALELLERTGFVVRDEGGRLKTADPKVSTPAQLTDPAHALAARNFHRGTLEHASKSLEALPADQRNAVSLTVRLTHAQYEELCRRNMEYLREILDQTEHETSADAATPEVFMLGMQLVPVTRKAPEPKPVGLKPVAPKEDKP